MQRRSFLASILAAGYAPAAIGSGVLMPVKRLVPEIPFGWTLMSPNARFFAEQLEFTEQEIRRAFALPPEFVPFVQTQNWTWHAR